MDSSCYFFQEGTQILTLQAKKQVLQDSKIVQNN